MVHDAPVGRHRVYSIDAASGWSGIAWQLDRFWSDALGNLAGAPDNEQERGDRVTVEPDGTVRHEVVVDLPREEAFWAFADLDRIKPREHNMLAVPIEETVLEQHAGGDVYDRGVDGSTCRWGRVLAFDPPRTIALQLGHRPGLADRLRPQPHQ